MLIALGAWTVAYHACLLVGAGTTAALAMGAAAFVGGCWALRHPREPSAVAFAPATTSRRTVPAWVLPTGVLAAAVAAVLFAFTSAPWALVCLIWLVAAACALAATYGRADAPASLPLRTWIEPTVVSAWALAMAALSLFLLEPDGDDAYYVHLAAWTANHGAFPIRDVLYSNQVLPALFYPPVPSYEGLLGAFGRLTALPVQGILYYGVTPVAAVLSVFALWRLLRWVGAAAPALALSVALAFLLFDAGGHQTFGAFFVGRIWQGKVIFLTLVVPLLFALLLEYAERPSRRGLVMLAAAGAAATGLTTTAIFVVPVIAAAGMAVLAPLSRPAAVRGFAAATAYPLGAAAVTLALGGRQPDPYTNRDVVAARLVHFALGHGVGAFVALAAVLAAPLLLRPARVAQVAAVSALLVGLALAPSVPRVIFHASGLGRVLWRLAWALPVAALVGATATAPLRSGFPVAARLAPALALVAALVLGGHAIWSLDGVRLAHRPSWKLDPAAAAASRSILARAGPGDVVLAPLGVSTTLVTASAAVTAVSARDFYTAALVGVTGSHARERQLLERFAELGLHPDGGGAPRVTAVTAALRAVGVDIACVPGRFGGSVRLLRHAGYAREFRAGKLGCLRAA